MYTPNFSLIPLEFIKIFIYKVFQNYENSNPTCILRIYKDLLPLQLSWIEFIGFFSIWEQVKAISVICGFLCSP